MNYKKMAQEILNEVGGPENIRNMTHCATRLRLTLKDTSIVNDESVKAIDGVVNVVNKAGQYQLQKVMVQSLSKRLMRVLETSLVIFFQLFQQFLLQSFQH
jgi:glucose-like phosphotransferase system IIB component